MFVEAASWRIHGAMRRRRVKRLSNNSGRVEVFDLHLYNVVELNLELGLFLLPHIVIQTFNLDFVALIIEPTAWLIRILAARLLTEWAVELWVTG